MKLSVDCITLAFDDNKFNVLLTKIRLSTDRFGWDILSEDIKDDDNLDCKTRYIAQKYTALEDTFVEQIRVYNKASPETGKRIFSVAYIVLVNMNEHQTVSRLRYRTQWFPIEIAINLVMESQDIIEFIMQWLRFKSAQHPYCWNYFQKSLPYLNFSTYIKSYIKQNSTKEISKRKFYQLVY